MKRRRPNADQGAAQRRIDRMVAELSRGSADDALREAMDQEQRLHEHARSSQTSGAEDTPGLPGGKVCRETGYRASRSPSMPRRPRT